MANYIIRDAGGAEETFDAKSYNDAVSYAENWLRNGNWVANNHTVWISALLLWNDAEGEEDRTRVRIAIEPQVPKCSAPKHAWGDETVQGHGGGVVVRDVCEHCECVRTLDTWAQDPATGVQGLCSVEYMSDLE